MDTDHSEILSEGVDRWNAWRSENPTVWPTLIQADLRGADLTGVNLENANLLRAEMSRASLREANLRNANLKESRAGRVDFSGATLLEANLFGSDLRESILANTNLCEANLSNADLRSASLVGADLNDANLSTADLRLCNLSGAQLSYTNLCDAKLDGAVFDFAVFSSVTLCRTVLSSARGLERAVCDRNSSIDIETMERTMTDLRGKPSRFQAMRAFLLRSGVPDHLLEHYADSVVRCGWLSCFISYSHVDERFASFLWGRLQTLGVSCFLDSKSMHAGQPILDQVGSEIVSHDKLLLACSKSSLASSWVSREIDVALKKERAFQEPVLLPLDLDGFMLSPEFKGDLADTLRSRVVASFVGWERDPSDLRDEFGKIERALRIAE